MSLKLHSKKGIWSAQVPFLRGWAIIEAEGGVDLSQEPYWDIREIVANAAKKMSELGLAGGTAGNVSGRAADGRIAITPTGVPYESMTAEQVCVVNLDGKVVAGELKPSSELPMHTAVYGIRPDVGGIVHTHSLYATSFAVAGRPIEAVHYVIATIGDEIPVIPYYLYGSEALAKGVTDALTSHQGVLLGNHGVLALGTDVPQALYHAETIEYLAQLQLLAEQAGPPQVLTQAQLAEVRERFSGYGQK